MLILMNSEHKKEDLERVIAKVEKLGFKAHVIPGARSVAVGVTSSSSTPSASSNISRIFSKISSWLMAIA